MKKILIIDSNNLLMRVYWVAKNYNRGLSVEHLFLNSIKKYHTMFQPDDIYCVWDAQLKYGESNYRKDGMHDYKGTRDKSKWEEIFAHTPAIEALTSASGIRNIYPGCLEADDVICWLVDRFPSCEKVIVSADQDLLQLVDSNTIVYSPIKDKIINESNFESIVKIPKPHFLHHKALVGDNSDNITGIPGIGPKRAANIIIQNSFKNLPADQYEVYKHNMDVVDLRKAYDFHPEEPALYEEQLNALLDIEPCADTFKQVCHEFGLDSVLDRYNDWKKIFFKEDFSNRLMEFLNA